MMNEVLKSKYYGLIENRDYAHYEMVGNALAALENKMICSNNIVAIQDLVNTIAPIQQTESEVYDEIEKDINNGIIGGGNNNE